MLHKMLQRLGFQLRKVLGPYVEECLKLLIKNGSSLTRFINKLLSINYCIIVSRPIHKSKGNLKTGLFLYIMTVMQVVSIDKPNL